MIRRLAALTAAGLTALTITSCATNPATGQSQLALVSESQEIQMGQQAAQQVQQTMGYVDDPGLQQYVSSIGMKIAKSTERPQLPWEFHVVNDPSVNAFALPGGFIFVTRGLITHITNEAQLASVLGHEIGHVTARHSVQAISRQELFGGILAIGEVLSPTVAKYGQIAGAGLSLLFLKYSRDQESQADQLGFRYALQNGYDVRQMVDLFQMLNRVSQASGGSQLPQWLETHPDPGNRIQATQQRLDTVHTNLASLKVNRDGYLQHADGVVFGSDPRDGYFQNGVFYQPTLGFQFSVPQGWQTANGADQVSAVSQQQDAAFQLSIVNGASPSQAATQFFQQQGVQPGQTGTTSVNGMPAAGGYFSAQTQQGQTVQGVVTFVSYNGHTYQLLGYSAAQTFSSYDQVFRQIINSFGRITNTANLRTTPARIQITKAPRGMTLEQFNQQYPSTVSIDEVALINQMQPNTMLSSGQEVKRVVGAAPVGE